MNYSSYPQSKLALRSIFLGLMLAAVMVMTIGGLIKQSSAQPVAGPPCSDCHVCNSPTPQEPCLKNCLRPDKADKAHSVSEGPKIAVLGQLRDQYEPVKFNHKLHAEMVGMGQGCATCHHYSPAGKFPPCRECHGEIPSNPQNLRQPGLKAAYHRQCLGCHREWSHETKCVVCHLPESGENLASLTDPTDIMGVSHPVLPEPVTKIYHTPYEEGPLVTFHHKQHLNHFDLSCANCHKGESCGNCHDLQKPVKVKKTMEEVHAICNDCHRTDSCDKCHGTKEKPRFTHAMTGWPLNQYHAQLDCRACHPTGKRISRLNNNCSSCHAGWNQSNFRHAVVGLRLDEMHSGLSCGDCHVDLNYSAPPNCAVCHTDSRTAKTAPPGKWLENKKS